MCIWIGLLCFWGGLHTFCRCVLTAFCLLCFVSARTIEHRWMFPGYCPHPVGNWSWVPFRNQCYSFILHELQFKHEAIRMCNKGNHMGKNKISTRTYYTHKLIVICDNVYNKHNNLSNHVYPFSVGAELLSILDENENSFVWEHMQSFQQQAHGAWLGMIFNSKGKKFNEHHLFPLLTCSLHLLYLDLCVCVRLHRRQSGVVRQSSSGFQ